MPDSILWRNIVAQKLLVDTGVMASLAATTLFYPCSGDDWENVVPLFIPYVDSYWFVDTAYRQRPAGYLRNADQWGLNALAEPIIAPVDLPKDDVNNDCRYRNCAPFVQTERFRHEPSGAERSIHWIMRRGPSALRAMTSPIGIFLYRGDSDEGGSGTRWLIGHRRFGQMHDVLQRLVPGGLIITDGSNSRWSGNNPYRALGAFLGRNDLAPAEAAREANSFSHNGRTFECVGYIDVAQERYKGPVLVWQAN